MARAIGGLSSGELGGESSFFHSLEFHLLDLTITGQAHARQVELEAGPSRPKNKVSATLTGIRLQY